MKLSELSEVVGNYEKLRLQDQQAIQKLKERLQKLDVENATLSRQISTDENRTPDNERELLEDETPEELKKQVFKLKGLLKIAMDSSDKPLDLGKNSYFLDHTLYVCSLMCFRKVMFTVRHQFTNLGKKIINSPHRFTHRLLLFLVLFSFSCYK